MADARRKKAIVFNKDDLRRGADDIRKEFENIKSSGKSSARGVQEAFESLGKRAKTALNEAFDGNSFKGLKDIEESLKIQRKAVDDLTEQYKKAKAEFDSVNIGTQDSNLIAKREKASKLFRESKAELESETNLLKKQEEAFKLISNELQTAGDKSVTFYTQMRQIREEMNKLALAGKDQTPEYDNLRSKLDEVSVAYRKVQQEQQMLAKYGNMLIPGLIQGMSGLAGAFSVYQGVSSLFIKDNEKLAEVQTKLQSAMALTIGLQQVQQTLHSTSSFRIGVVRKATQAWTTAQNALNTSLGISKGLAGAFMTGGIMALVAGVGYLITKYREWSREQEKLKNFFESFTQSIASEKAQLDYLFDAYNKAEQGTKAYKDAKKEILEQLDKYYSGLDSEKLLIEDTAEAYNKLSVAIQGAAKEKALQDKYEEAAETQISKISESYSKIYSSMVKDVGESAADVFFKNVKEDIETVGSLSNETLKELSEYSRDESYFKHGKWRERTFTFNVGDVLKEVDVIKKANIEYTSSIEDATRLYSVFASKNNETKEEEKDSILSLIETQKKLREEAEKLPETTEEEIKAKNRKLQVIDEEIKRLESLGIEEKRTPKAVAKKQDFNSLFADKEYEYRKAQIKEKEKLLEIEEEQEIESFKKRAEENKFTEEETQKYITLTRNMYALERQKILDQEFKDEEDSWIEYNRLYGSYQEKKLAITQEYERKIQVAKTSGEKAILRKEMDKELSGLITSLPDYNTFFTSIYALTKKKAQEIGNLIRKNLKEQLDKGVISVQEYYDGLKKINEELKKSQQGISYLNSLQTGGLDGLLNQIQNVGDSKYNKALNDHQSAKQDYSRYLNEWSNAMKIGDKASANIAHNNMQSATNMMNMSDGAMQGAEGMQQFAGAAQGVVGTIDMIVTAIDQSVQATQRIVDVFADLAEQRGIDTTKGTWGDVRQTMGIISDINAKGSESWKSLKEGDVAGSLASAVEMVAVAFRSVNGEHKEALRLLKLQREQLEHQYKIQELLKKLEDSKSVFGSDAWGQSRRSAEVYATSIEELNSSISKLQDVEVVTGSRKSGWGPWKKRKDVWTPILEAYPKLIKSSGEFDKTLAENILSTQKLSDEGKFALQSAIDNADALEQAYAQMSDNLSAVFGNLGATIMDTFSEAFKSGKDGFADMFDSAGDMLEQFTKQMIYSVTLQPIMEEASKQMMDIQSSSKSDTAKLDMMMEIISSTINDAKNQEDRVNVLLGYAKEQAGKQGLDILNDSKEQKASTGVSKVASQDSIDVLDGRLTHVQETNQEISNNSNAILEQMRTSFTTLNEQMETSRNITLQSMYHLADISKNTNELYAMNKTLQRIDNNTKGL